MKLLAIDMDGTCLDPHSRITDSTLEALRMAADSNILIIPTTGRALSCLPHQLIEESFYRYVITSNGAQVTDLQTNATIFQALIPRLVAQELLHSCHSLKLGLTAHIHQEYLLQGRLLALLGRIFYKKDARKALCVKDLAHIVKTTSYDIEELQFYFFSSSASSRLKEILASYPQLLAAYTGSYVEIFSQNASKGNALAALAAHLHIPTSQIACIGDGENDLSMFQSSGLRFAMGNAVPALKEKADHILPSNGQEGVAHAIRKYLL